MTFRIINWKSCFTHGIFFTAGNNIYGEDIRHTLLGNPESRSQYILMDRIQPEISKNFMVRQELTNIQSSDVIPELGIVGIFIR